MDNILCVKDPIWIEMTSDEIEAIGVANWFEMTDKQAVKAAEKECTVQIVREIDFGKLVSEASKIKFMLQKMLMPEAKAFRFKYQVKLFTYRYVVFPGTKIPIHVLVRFFKKEELEEEEMYTKNLQETLSLNQASILTIELLLRVVNDMVRNQIHCETLQYFPGIFRELRYNTDEDKRYRGLSLKSIWKYISTERQRKTNLPFSEVLVGLAELISDVTMGYSYEESMQHAVPEQKIDFPGFTVTLKRGSITGNYLIQRVIRTREDFFNAVLGRSAKSRRINTQSQSTQNTYFEFLSQSLKARSKDLVHLKASGSNDVKEKWLIALKFVADKIFEMGCLFFCVLPEWMQGGSFFLFKGFTLFEVCRFAMVEMGFFNPTKIPESIYPVRIKKRK
jgi:hypothetical protein